MGIDRNLCGSSNKMLLQLEKVTKTYTGATAPVSAVTDLSYGMESGQFLALCGPSGCGKSTLLMMAGGMMRPDSGSVRVDGQDLNTLSTEDRARFRAGNIGFVFQQFHLVPYLNVLDNVMTAALGVPLSSRSGDNDLRSRADALLESFGLTDRAQHVPARLSTGEQQRTALARALLNRPQLVLADEPTGNLDEENSCLVLDALSQFARDGGGILLVTHDLQAASRADVVVRMERGRMVDDGVAKVQNSRQ